MTAKFSVADTGLRQGSANLQRLVIFRFPDGAPGGEPSDGSRDESGVLEVQVRREADAWWLEYFLAVPGLRVPAASATAERRDELWRHTCAECFVRVGATAYLEFNFSPSGDWAAYFFDDYRQGMRAHRWAGDEGALAPRVYFEAPCLRVWLPVGAVLDASAGDIAGARAGAGAGAASLAAVTETAAGLQYWALHHPLAGQAPGGVLQARPDFHHPGGFVWALPSGASELLGELAGVST